MGRRKPTVMDSLTKEQWDQVFKRLSHRERGIIVLRFGLGDGYCYTLEEIGHIYKITRGKVARVIEKTERITAAVEAAKGRVS